MVVEFLVTGYLAFWGMAGLLCLTRAGVQIRPGWVAGKAFWILLNVFLAGLAAWIVSGFMMAEVFSQT